MRYGRYSRRAQASVIHVWTSPVYNGRALAKIIPALPFCTRSASPAAIALRFV
jgi:hypothetical protein